MSAGIMGPVYSGASRTYTNSIDRSQAEITPPNEHARTEGRARAGSADAVSGHYLDTRAYLVHKPDLNKRLGKLAKGHHRALQMAAFIQNLEDPEHMGRAEKLRTCGAWLVIRDWVRSGKVKLKAGMFCHQHTLCPLCAQLRAGKLVMRYVDLVRKVLGDRKLTVCTFTVKSGPDLVERLKHLQKAVALLMAKARRARSGGRNLSEFSKFEGGVISYEVKRGRGTGGWHPHGHALCLQSEKVDIAALRDEWRNATKDSCNVDLALVKGDPIKAFLEVFKYAMKFGDLTLADNWHASRCLHRKRLLRSWGDLFGIEMPDELEDDDSEESGEFVDRFFKYMPALQSYTCAAAQRSCK